MFFCYSLRSFFYKLVLLDKKKMKKLLSTLKNNKIKIKMNYSTKKEIFNNLQENLKKKNFEKFEEEIMK
jgi:hypothetical protein